MHPIFPDVCVMAAQNVQCIMVFGLHFVGHVTAHAHTITPTMSSVNDVDIGSLSLRILVRWLEYETRDGETTSAIYVMETTGRYVCIVYTTDGRSIQESLVVPDPTPPPVTVTPPTNLTAKWVDGADGSLGNIQVTWGVPRHSDNLEYEWQLATCNV